MPSKLELMLEAERRGLEIPEDKKALLMEARRRGLVPPPEITPKEVTPFSSGISALTAPGRYLESGMPILEKGIQTLRETLTSPQAGIFQKAAAAAALTPTGGIPPKVARTIAEFAQPLPSTGLGLGLQAATLGIPLARRLAIRALPESLASTIYESGAKFGTKLTSVERANRIKTAIEEEIPLTKEGVEKVKSVIGGIQDKIDNVLKVNKEPIDTLDILINYTGLVKKQFGNTIFGKKYLDEIVRLEDDILSTWPEKIPTKAAQEIKIKTNALIGKYYGELSGVQQEFQKGIVKGLKENLENRYPELKKLNATEGANIELLKSLEQAVNRIGNRDIRQLGSLIAIGTGSTLGAAIGGSMGAAPGAIFAVLATELIDNPKIKSKIAIALYRARKTAISKISPTQKAAFLAIQAGKSIPQDQ